MVLGMEPKNTAAIEEIMRLKVELKGMYPHWRDINTAPKDGGRILAWCSEWTAPSTAQFYPRGWGLDYELGPFKYQPTLWMPLPEKPDTGER